MTIREITRDVETLRCLFEDLKEAQAETNRRLHGIEMRLLEERALSNAFIYNKIAELQKQMLNGDGSQGEPVNPQGF